MKMKIILYFVNIQVLNNLFCHRLRGFAQIKLYFK